MIVINIFGVIEQTLLSDKFQLYISNLNNNQKKKIKEQIYEEIQFNKFEKLRTHHLYSEYEYIDYDLNFFREIVDMNIPKYNLQDIITIESCINLLIDNMVCLSIDDSSKEIQTFNWETNPFERRYIQGDYAEKLFNFIHFILEDKLQFPLNTIYSINWYDAFKNNGVLNQLLFKLSRKMIPFPTINELVIDLKNVSRGIDNYISSENDYYKLDYIISNISKDGGFSHYHFIKYYALLEMLLFKNNSKNEVKDQILSKYLTEEYNSQATNVALLLRQMRNKISHGNFKGYFKKADKYATKYMQNFHFDYNEYNRQEWILMHTTFLLSDTLKKVLIAIMNLA